MSLDDDVHLLATIPLLSDFRLEQVRLLAFGAEMRAFDDEEKLFSAGDSADGAHVVAKGSVKLCRMRDDGEVTVETVAPGCLLGELALLTPMERPISAIADGPVETIFIRRSLFHRVLTEYPELAAVLQKRIRARLARTNIELAGIGRAMMQTSFSGPAEPPLAAAAAEPEPAPPPQG